MSHSGNAPKASWTSDNGDGTFTNPLFYEEFSDPDIIRVGDDFLMTGTTMHTMPGLPVLRSRDLVNWELLTYAFDRLDLGPQFRLEGGEIYGQGIWAPCLRHHGGQFFIFTNINGQRTQLFSAKDPAGPWSRTECEYALHDLSVLFDDDGRTYVIWGYQGVRIAELDGSLTRILPGTERALVAPDAGLGEGVHFYRLNGRYFITSAWFEGRMRMPAARADHIDGPWEINPAISIDEDFGLMEGYRMRGGGLPFTATPPFEVVPPNPAPNGRLSLHQGGIVDTPEGEWWGFSMMDYNSLGRLTCLSPITWHEGWPYFGLPGNLGRTPRTWVKPAVKSLAAPRPLFERNDNFDGTALKPIWQWNHAPDDARWSLSARPGVLRLETMPATSLWDARNTLTQRAVGPISTATAVLDGTGLADGDVAGLGLLGLPWRTIGLRRQGADYTIEMHDQQTGEVAVSPVRGPKVWLRTECDFLAEEARFSFSADGARFTRLGPNVTMVYQLKTFQGIRYALYAFNTEGHVGGHADFDSFAVEEPYPRGLMHPIPVGETGHLLNYGDPALGLSLHDSVPVAGPPAAVDVRGVGLGRVALRMAGGHLAISADGLAVLAEGEVGDADTWQWIETPTGEVVLMSLFTHRFLRIADGGMLRADSPGPQSDGRDGVRFVWQRA